MLPKFDPTDVIHIDIKPRKVLIFQNEYQQYFRELAEFGSSMVSTEADVVDISKLEIESHF